MAVIDMVVVVGYGAHSNVLQDAASGRPGEVGLLLLEQQREESRAADDPAPGSTEWQQVNMNTTTSYRRAIISLLLFTPSSEAAMTKLSSCGSCHFCCLLLSLHPFTKVSSHLTLSPDTPPLSPHNDTLIIITHVYT